MRHRPSSLRIIASAASFAACWLLACGVQAQTKPRPKSIQFSEPRSDEITTNLNLLGSRKDGLRQMEDSLFHPLQSVSPKSSLDGVFVPPPHPILVPNSPSKRAREMRDRQKNWAFMDPADFEKEPA